MRPPASWDWIIIGMAKLITPMRIYPSTDHDGIVVSPRGLVDMGALAPIGNNDNGPPKDYDG